MTTLAQSSVTSSKKESKPKGLEGEVLQELGVISASSPWEGIEFDLVDLLDPGLGATEELGLVIQDGAIVLTEEVMHLLQVGRDIFASLREGGYRVTGGQIVDSKGKIVDSLTLSHTGKSLDLDPDYEIDPIVEIQKYIDEFSAAYRKEVERLSVTVPMPIDECRFSACIPVAGTDESPEMIRCGVQSLVNQVADSKLFEILVFINAPKESVNPNAASSVKAAISEVEKLQRENPEHRIHLMTGAIPRDDISIGFIRKLVTDVSLYRFWKKFKGEVDPILYRVDIDTHGVRNGAISHYIRLFDENPHIDAFKGRLESPPADYIRSPLLYLSERATAYFDHASQVQSKQVGLGGANFTIRGSRYAIVGGYQSEKLGEDVSLGKRLVEFRKGAKCHQAIGYAGGATTVYTDARRGLAAINMGWASVEQWSYSETAFDCENHDIRSRSKVGRRRQPLLGSDTFNKIAGRILTRAMIASEVLIYKNSTSDRLVLNPETPPRLIRRVLNYLGLVVRFKKDGILILDSTRFVRTYEKYCKDAISGWERRTR